MIKNKDDREHTVMKEYQVNWIYQKALFLSNHAADFDFTALKYYSINNFKCQQPTWLYDIGK